MPVKAFRLCRLVQFGGAWSSLLAIWCNLVHIDATSFRLVEVGATWCSLVQTGSAT